MAFSLFSGVNQSLAPYLRQDEEVIAVVRAHPAVLIGSFALTLVSLLGAAVLTSTFFANDSSEEAFVWLTWGLLFLRLVWKTLAWVVDYLVISSSRILCISGFTRRRAQWVSLAKVTDISLRRSSFGLLLGYGELVLESVYRDPAIRFVRYIPYPDELVLLLLRTAGLPVASAEPR